MAVAVRQWQGPPPPLNTSPSTPSSLLPFLPSLSLFRPNLSTPQLTSYLCLPFARHLLLSLAPPPFTPLPLHPFPLPFL